MATASNNDPYEPWRSGLLPARFMCQECKDIIWSASPGEFAMCSCKKSYVDQTPHYYRLGGVPVEFTPPQSPETPAQQ